MHTHTHTQRNTQSTQILERKMSSWKRWCFLSTIVEFLTPFFHASPAMYSFGKFKHLKCLTVRMYTGSRQIEQCVWVIRLISRQFVGFNSFAFNRAPLSDLNLKILRRIHFCTGRFRSNLVNKRATYYRKLWASAHPFFTFTNDK